MKILAIESSAMTASVALLQDETVLYQHSTNFKKTHSETLLPMIDALKASTGLDLKTLDAIAVSEGPGSFTGLRIGAATAKGLAFALNIPIIPIPTLAGMAYRHLNSSFVICPMIDARRNQVYSALFASDKNQLETLIDTELFLVQDMIEKAEEEAKKRNTGVLYMGDGVRIYSSVLREKMGEHSVIALPHLCFEDAAANVCLAAELFREGKTVTAESFTPVYLRKSQAEQERMEKGLPIE